MRVRFVVRQALPQGGLTLATFRLAQALVEAGHEADVLFADGEAPPELRDLAHRDDRLADPRSGRGLVRTLESNAPDLLLICEDSPEWLRVAASVAPTLLHAHMHWGVCADAARYWNRLARPCAIHAGWRCTALRPLLGCSDVRTTLNPRNVARQVRMRALLADGVAGVVCVSTDQAELYAAHDVPASRTMVLPNLGIRMSADELRAVAAATPERWRSAIAFFGRLTKAKGAALLPHVAEALAGLAPLRVFGEGYLASDLEQLPPASICGQIGQPQVAGVLMWARAVVFPSLWPEPGGIVGIDAQIMGVPLAAFDVGAARFWPAAARFPHGDALGIAAWLADQESPSVARDPATVAALQDSYWSRIAHHASCSFEAFLRHGAFGGADRSPAERLIVAPG
jgi:glycosyltransferase involved in cell wall biosynthesis